MRAIMQGNRYVSASSINWQYYIRLDYVDPKNPVPARPLSHEENCSCTTSSNYIKQAFYTNENTNKTLYIPGMFFGCRFSFSLIFLFEWRL